MNNQQTCKSQKVMNQILFTLTSLVVLWVILWAIIFAIRKNLFPIQERSPLLTIISAIGLTIYCTQYPFWLIWNPNISIQNIRNDIIFMFIQDIGLQIFVLAYLFKGLRLIYALNYYKYPRFQRIFSSQKYLILIIGIIIFLTLPTYFLFVKILPQNAEEIININNYQKEFFLYLSIFLNIILIYIIRNLQSKYSFMQEYIICLILLITILDEIFIVKQAKEDTYVCSVYIIQQCINLVFLFLYVTLVIVVPLKNATRYHQPLTPSLILENFTYFIKDEMCLKIFIRYLKQNYCSQIHQQNQYEEIIHQNQSSKSGSIDVLISQYPKQSKFSSISEIEEYSQQDVLKVFSFYVECLMIFNENGTFDIEEAIAIIQKHFKGDNQIQQFFEVIDQKGQFQRSNSFMEQLKQNFHLIRWNDQNSIKQFIERYSNETQQQMLAQIIIDYFYISQDFLMIIYKQKFEKTKSFEKLKEILIRNEEMEIIFYRMGMTKIQENKPDIELHLSV